MREFHIERRYRSRGGRIYIILLRRTVQAHYRYRGLRKRVGNVKPVRVGYRLDNAVCRRSRKHHLLIVRRVRDRFSTFTLNHLCKTLYGSLVRRTVGGYNALIIRIYERKRSRIRRRDLCIRIGYLSGKALVFAHINAYGKVKRSGAAGAALKPSGGNCAVLP